MLVVRALWSVATASTDICNSSEIHAILLAPVVASLLLVIITIITIMMSGTALLILDVDVLLLIWLSP